jgi:hypothetical protein
VNAPILSGSSASIYLCLPKDSQQLQDQRPSASYFTLGKRLWVEPLRPAQKLSMKENLSFYAKYLRRIGSAFPSGFGLRASGVAGDGSDGGSNKRIGRGEDNE